MAELAKHILLVDDDADCRLICRTFLTYAGFRITECGDGETAVRLASTNHPDLILMDLSLPVLDGWGAARTLKERRDTRGIPIVALTAHALPGDRTRAAAAGFDAYLTKPAALRDVLAELHRRLGIPGPARFMSAP